MNLKEVPVMKMNILNCYNKVEKCSLLKVAQNNRSFELPV